jgi:glycosyltransferase involved in cell wall biosynthesis
VSKGIVPADRIVMQPSFIAVPVAPGEGPGEGFVFLGRLTPEKGLRTLLEAQKLAKVPLKIIGQDPTEWRPLAGDGVEFLGRVPREEALKIVAGSRALVFSSEWPEGCPSVIQEAMALGRPVVASRVAGAMDLIRERETGLFFEPGNSPQLAEKMRELYENPGPCAEMGQRARERYGAEYSPEAGYRRLIELMQK